MSYETLLFSSVFISSLGNYFLDVRKKIIKTKKLSLIDSV
jgi:hypothetical protein